VIAAPESHIDLFFLARSERLFLDPCLSLPGLSPFLWREAESTEIAPFKHSSGRKTSRNRAGFFASLTASPVYIHSV
jgi:hypothetical protein